MFRGLTYIHHGRKHGDWQAGRSGAESLHPDLQANRQKETETHAGPGMCFGNLKAHPPVTYLLQQGHTS